ncbi:unnamed protein product [Clonostachys solani]|uniref:Uncharacterized protein n=1 Tax=Clonostachys solani TaxID=160281 RepID=A0A9P0ENU2_9HYPO|nr:unnamed protein product [Clonostachys solani]
MHHDQAVNFLMQWKEGTKNTHVLGASPVPQSDYILEPRHHPPQSHDVICRSTQRLQYPTYEVRSTSGQQNGYNSPISPFLQQYNLKQASLPLFGPGLGGVLFPSKILDGDLESSSWDQFCNEPTLWPTGTAIDGGLPMDAQNTWILGLLASITATTETE